MKVLTTAEMRSADAASSLHFGVPSLTLMENAGAAVAQFVLHNHAASERVTVICGKGNNGGDGFVAARKLNAAGRNVHVLLLADPGEVQGDAAAMLGHLPHRLLTAIRSAADLEHDPARHALRAPVLIDAILGSGFRPPVEGLYAVAISAINGSHAQVLAVDVPSGTDSDQIAERTIPASDAQGALVAHADAVITFTAPRPAHVFTQLTTGPVVVAPIGSPEAAVISTGGLQVITPREVAPLLAPRALDANKGNFGHVVVIGGSIGKAGAPAMAAMAALRSGAGLVTAAVPQSILSTVASFMPELMTTPLDETTAGTLATSNLKGGNLRSSDLATLLQAADVLAVGPGLSRNPESARFVRDLAGSTSTRMVLDADGLNAFEGALAELNVVGRTLVLTPHPGEMARLVGFSTQEVQANRIAVARDFVRQHQVILVLKGHRTLIAFPDGENQPEVYVNTTGNPGMATGGTGDILTGMIAGLWAQHPTDARLAVLGAVFLHGLAGDIARQQQGELSLIATDLIAALPDAMRKVRQLAAHPLQPIANHLRYLHQLSLT